MEAGDTGPGGGRAHRHATEPRPCLAVGLLEAEDGQCQQEPGVPVRRPETPASSARGPGVTLSWDVSSADPGSGCTFPECGCIAWPSPPRLTWPCGVGATPELGGTRDPRGFHRDHQTVVQLTNCHPVSEVPWGHPPVPELGRLLSPRLASSHSSSWGRCSDTVGHPQVLPPLQGFAGNWQPSQTPLSVCPEDVWAAGGGNGTSSQAPLLTPP